MTTEPNETDWTYSPEAAAKVARDEPRKPSTAPHWVRCEWMRGEKRCRLAEGHPGMHEPERTNETQIP